MQKFIVFALGLALASAEDAKPQGRQMNWNNYKPNYLQTYPGSSYDSSENFGTGSVLNPQIKPSMGNFQGLNSPTLDGQDMNNRDGSLSHNAYGYDDASDQSNNGNAIGFGYDYQRNLPTPSGRFYSSNSNPSALSANPIPNSFLRGMPRDPYEPAASSLTNLQNGKIPNYYQNAASFSVSSNNNTVNRAGYDEDTPLGGVSSISTGSMLSGTNMRNSLSRQDDFSYGTVNGGYSTIPPVGGTGYGYGSIPPVSGYGYGGANGGYGGGYGGSSYASPGYSSNYRVPYGGYSNYGTPSYSSAGYYGGYGSPSYGGGYSGGYGQGYSSYGNSYNSPLYGGGYGNTGSYGYGAGYGNSPGGGYGGVYDYYELKPVSYKKMKKGLFDWFKFGNDIAPHGYGSPYATVPYDYYYDPPSIWFFSKLAFKSMVKSMFKPFFKWLPFCSPFFYSRTDRSDEKQSSLVSALTTFLPVGLFLAAIVPNIITVSAGRRKRSEAEEARQARDEATFPILDMISSYGVRSLQEPSCQSKIFCEIGRMGGLPEANVVQRALWLTANYVPERVSSIIGADQLFRQIRSQKCSEFICSSE